MGFDISYGFTRFQNWTARTRPDILKVVLGPYVQKLGQKLGQKPESKLKVIELSYCNHSICL